MARGSAAVPAGADGLPTGADALPTGVATFLFTDIEGSTRLVEELGPARYGDVLELQRQLLRAAFATHGGVEMGTEGDSFFVVFAEAPAAVEATADAQRALAGASWPHGLEAIRVRMGLHTGEAVLVDGTYVGAAVNRAARIAATAHGGQVVLSAATRTSVEAALPPGTRLRDLGEHRLRDLAEPERIAQLVIADLPADFPPLRSLESVPNNLPVQLTTFIGRDDDLVAVEDLLRTARLVTLTGPGGTGKSRLSLQVGADIADRFPDGVWFVPLAPISDPTLVGSAIAAALGVRTAGDRSIRDVLVDHLRDEDALIVLDNVEQVVEAAPLISDLLREAPRLRVLASSRIVLRVSGEHEVPLDALSHDEAVRLFVERARAVRPDFALSDDNETAVAEIAERLDRLPLAIELAAARSRLLAPSAMLARLDRRLDLVAADLRDLPARQRTIRGAIDWSYDLLDPGLRTVFARLSVFVGGGRLDDVEAVIGGVGDDSLDVLASIETLVEHSLLRLVADARGDRFLMLATIQEYAAERLAQGGAEESTRDRHAEHFLGLAETAAPYLTGSEQQRWLDRLDDDRDNLRAALGHAIATAEARLALALCAALWRYWQIRGHLYEGMTRVREALVLPRAGDHPAERLGALEAAGGLAWWLGDYPACADYYGQVLQGRLAEGDSRAIAQAYYNLGFPSSFTDDPVTAITYTNEALRRFEEIGDADSAARAHWGLSMHSLIGGDIDAARSEGEIAVAHFRAREMRFDLAWGLYILGAVAYLTGDYDKAGRSWVETLRMFHEVGDMAGIAMGLDPLATLAVSRGDRVRAARISGAVARLERLTGTGLNERNRAMRGGFDPTGLHDDPATATAWQEGEALPVDEAVAYALDVTGDAATGA